MKRRLNMTRKTKKDRFKSKGASILKKDRPENRPKGMSDFLQDNPKQTRDTQEHNSGGTQTTNSTNPEFCKKDPTERIDFHAPRELKWALEDHVKAENRKRERGNKLSMTSVIVEAVQKYLSIS